MRAKVAEEIAFLNSRVTAAERELMGGTLSLAVSAGAELRKRELRRRIAKLKREILRLSRNEVDAAASSTIESAYGDPEADEREDDQ